MGMNGIQVVSQVTQGVPIVYRGNLGWNSNRKSGDEILR